MTTKTSRNVQQSIGSNDLDCAESFFRDESKKNPNNQKSIFNLIKILSLRQKYKEIDEIIPQDNNQIEKWNDSLLFLTSKSLLKSNNFNQASKLLEILNKRQSESIEVALLYSESLFKLGNLDQAIYIINQSLKKWPNDPSLLNNKAIIHSELGNYIEAEEIYKNIIKLFPNHFLGYYNLALFYEKNFKFAEAISHLKICLEIVPNAPEAIKAYDRIINLTIQSNKKKDIKDIIYNLFANKDWEKAYLLLKEKESEIDNTQYYAFLSEMPMIYQDKLASSSYFDLNQIVKSYDLFDSKNKEIDLLTSSLKTESSLKWNRADKPTKDGYQTHEILIDKKSIYSKILEHKLIVQIKDYLKSTLFYETQCHNETLTLSGWGVILKSGGKQAKHIHPRSLISGVLYLKVPKNMNNNTQNNDGNLLFPIGEKLFINPKPGLLVLFPSYLPHETIPFYSSEERICIAFNYQL